MKVYFSLGNFNNQEEFKAYMALPEEEHAEDDFIMDLEKIIVGYRNIVLTDLDGKTQVIPRKLYGIAMSVAINDCAFITHGDYFKPFTVSQDADKETGFVFSYNSGVTYEDFLENIEAYVGHVVEFLVKRKQDNDICKTQRFVWDEKEFGPLKPDSLIEVMNVSIVK